MPDQDGRAWEAVKDLIARLTMLTQNGRVRWHYSGPLTIFMLTHRGIKYVLDTAHEVTGYELLVDGIPMWRGHEIYDLIRAVQKTIPAARPVIRSPELLDYRAPAVLAKALATLKTDG